MALQTLNKVITTIRDKDGLLQNCYLGNGASAKSCKAIYKGSTRIYDNAHFTFGYSSVPSYEVSASGGTINITAPTSTIAHGDDLTNPESYGYTSSIGGLAYTFPVYYGSTDRYIDVTLTQNNSGLSQVVRLTQKADVVISRTISILSFIYNSGEDIPVEGQSSIVVSALTIRAVETKQSGATSTTDYNLLTNKPSWCNIAYSGTNVDETTGAVQPVSGVTTETQRTLVTTSSVVITDNLSNRVTSSYSLYQAANSVIFIEVSTSDSDYEISAVGETKRMVVIGTLESGDTTNDISTSCTWSSSATSHITISKISGCIYAEFAENEESTQQSYSITALYSGISGSVSFIQLAGNFKYLLVNMPTSQTTYYLGTPSGAATWCKGVVKTSGQISFNDDNLITYGIAVGTYRIYTSQSSAGATNYTIDLSAQQIYYINNKIADVTVTATEN